MKYAMQAMQQQITVTSSIQVDISVSQDALHDKIPITTTLLNIKICDFR